MVFEVLETKGVDKLLDIEGWDEGEDKGLNLSILLAKLDGFEFLFECMSSFSKIHPIYNKIEKFQDRLKEALLFEFKDILVADMQVYSVQNNRKETIEVKNSRILGSLGNATSICLKANCLPILKEVYI